jgi:hypothetical protein
LLGFKEQSDGILEIMASLLVDRVTMMVFDTISNKIYGVSVVKGLIEKL